MRPSLRFLQLTAIAISSGIAACSSAGENEGTTVTSIEASTRISDGGAFCEEPGRYVVQGDLVLDEGNASPLEWQRDVPSAAYTHSGAAAYCDSLRQDGSGWRLPTVSELVSLVLHPLGLGGSPAPTCVPAIDQTAFPATPADDFWTSSINLNSNDAMYTGFFVGRSHPADLSTPMSVRCVRAASPSSAPAAPAAPATALAPRSPAPE